MRRVLPVAVLAAVALAAAGHWLDWAPLAREQVQQALQIPGVAMPGRVLTSSGSRWGFVVQRSIVGWGMLRVATAPAADTRASEPAPARVVVTLNGERFVSPETDGYPAVEVPLWKVRRAGARNRLDIEVLDSDGRRLAYQGYTGLHIH